MLATLSLLQKANSQIEIYFGRIKTEKNEIKINQP